MAASVLGAGFKTGKKLLVQSVEEQKSSAIEQARLLAHETLDREVDEFVQKSLRHLLKHTLIKIIAFASLFVIYELGWISSRYFIIGSGILIGIFLIRDIIKIAPAVKKMALHLHQNGWHPRKAVTHYVSASVFDQALQEISMQTSNTKTKIWLHLAGTTPHQLSVEIAKAVAEITSETSYEQIKPRIIMGAIKAGIIILTYSVIIYTLFRFV